MELTDKLKKYAKSEYNVILTGRHGVGKTAIIKEVFGEVFGEHMIKWRYFSASTLDPWVDFIGIPKNYTRPDGMEVFKIIPPEHFTGDEEIEALFFDEINRADSKTLNALMELIQFKSINGRKFKNLKCVWAAENPHDDKDSDYSVMPLDPAQKDRFQIQLNVPNELNKNYFQSKFGKDVYYIASEWWDKHKMKISPRKLDDMLMGHQIGFDLSDFTTLVDTRELVHSINSISEYEKMLSVSETASLDDIKSYFTLDKIRTNEKIIKKDRSKKLIKSIYEHLDEEIQAFVSKEFKYYVRDETGSANGLKPEQLDFVEKYSEDMKVPFGPFNLNAIKLYVTEFRTTFGVIEDTVDYTEVVTTAFPFAFDNTISTPHIREIVKAFNGDMPLVREWFSKSMFMIAHSTAKDKSNIELTQILVKLTGNRDFVKFIKINKIFFNGWKKDFPADAYKEYLKRMS
jgi:hypothetical protein